MGFIKKNTPIVKNSNKSAKEYAFPFLANKNKNIRENILPVLGPSGGEEEVQALREVIESGWWGKGPKVEEFEEKFAQMVGHKYAVAVTSNSHGQDLVMKAMGFKGVDVINPAISFIATAIVPLWNDCTSNIVDVKKEDLCIDPREIEKYKKPNSEVLISVDQAGVLADYKIKKIFWRVYNSRLCS